MNFVRRRLSLKKNKSKIISKLKKTTKGKVPKEGGVLLSEKL